MRSYQHLCLIPLLAGLCACQPETTTQVASTATADKATTIVSASAVAAPAEIIPAVAPIAPSKSAPTEPVTAKSSGIKPKVRASAVLTPKVAAPKAATAESAAPAIAKIEPEAKADAALSAADALQLAKKSGCLTCHAIDKKVVGPAWKDVAAKYRGDTGAQSRLSSKVAKGGSGVWGSMAMPANSPRVADADINSLVRFILLLK